MQLTILTSQVDNQGANLCELHVSVDLPVHVLTDLMISYKSYSFLDFFIQIKSQ